MAGGADWRGDRIGAALAGENPMVMAVMRSGFAVIGDTQFLPGYSVLLSADPTVRQLTELNTGRRSEFLIDMTLLGEAIQHACMPNGLRRMNYEILGNTMPELHAHVIPRYAWEPAHSRARQALSYGEDQWFAPEHAYTEAAHGVLRQAITEKLERLMAETY